MRRAGRISSCLACVVLAACFIDKGGETAPTEETGVATGVDPVTTGADTSGSSGASGGTGVTSGATSTGASSEDPGDETCDGACETTEGPEPARCDLFVQDCPAGQKCAAYGGEATGFTGSRCVAVTGDAAPGGECTVEGGMYSGLDDCRPGAQCWFIDDGNDGFCVELCGGEPMAPTCSPTQTCAAADDGVVNLCLTGCDPLQPSCGPGQVCVVVAGEFSCAPEAGGVAEGPFDACEVSNACQAGLLCVAPTLSFECDDQGSGCCLYLCDLSDPDAACPGMGETCVPLLDAMVVVSDKYKHLGLCVETP